MMKRDRRDTRKRIKVTDDVLRFDKEFIRSQTPSYINEKSNRKLLITVLHHVIEEEMTECQRLYLKQYFYEKMTMREIAEQSGVNIATVSRTLTRAKKNLRRAMERYMFIMNHMNDDDTENEEGGIWANAY